jgi:hypothetical protein
LALRSYYKALSLWEELSNSEEVARVQRKIWDLERDIGY